ncbi:hypothetical protein [Dolichospermum sp. UHCC 0259]|uniref:hypothetical protein n=1 Tax=Dolichospermum sp. UHCC 0259 TaxID=2590010 RepID=UPI00144895EB|nr:hypothetical protein [Dolichospermum sp. UHCC 0259]
MVFIVSRSQESGVRRKKKEESKKVFEFTAIFTYLSHILFLRFCFLVPLCETKI